jgi:tRNA threonylcarbamoyladenosine biosynthesis protein TsaB
MVNLLAIETSGECCSVCLEVDGNRFSRSEHAERKHNEMLLPMLGDVRRQAGLDPAGLNERLDAVAFGRGPGSFTGIRIAASAAQAIAFAAGAGILRVSCSEALALKGLREQPDAEGVITFIRSRRDLFFLASYRNVDGRPVEQHWDVLFENTPGDDWHAAVDGWIAVGEGAPQWWTGTAPVPMGIDAEQVLEIGNGLHERGAAVAPALGLPDYPEGDAPWRKSR